MNYLKQMVAGVCVTLSTCVYAQNTPIQLMPDMRSRDMIYAGMEAHDREQYDSALAFFNWVHPNDSNYSWAIAERLNTMLAQERYRDLISAANQKIAIPLNYHKGSMYMSLGTAYDELEKADSALLAYDNGIAYAPMNVRLHFNKAVTHVRKKEYQKAYEKLKDALRINPYHASSHYLLGAIAVEQGDLVPGALALSTFIMLEPGTERGYNALVLLNEVLTEKSDINDHGVDFGESFRKTELLVKNYAALKKSYKVPSKLDIGMIKQVHLIYKQTTPNKEGFISQFYIPFFKQVVGKDDYFEGFSYLIMAPSKNDKHQEVIAKNVKDIKEFAGWAKEEWANVHLFTTDTLQGKNQEVRNIWRNDRTLSGVSQWNKETDRPEGFIRFFDANGSLSATGYFDSEGERTGVWQWYDATGILTERTEYKSGKPAGTTVGYDWYGRKVIERHWKEGEPHGNRVNYYPTGQVRNSTPFKSGKMHGQYQSFYPQGELDFEVPLTDGEQNGEGIAYYQNGNKASVVSYKSAQMQGAFKRFYSDGTLKEESNYKDGEKTGSYKTYYQNGQLETEGTVANGARAAQWKGFNEDGTPDYKSSYDENGKISGIYQDFDQQGRVYHEIEYKKGKIVAYRYLNAQGNLLHDAKVGRKKTPFKGFHANGAKSSDGFLTNGEKDDLWTYYNAYGIIRSQETYKEGLENGFYKWYFNDGKFLRQVPIVDAKNHGLMLEYYPDSTLFSQGRYVKGSSQGAWFYYNLDGSLSAEKFYANDEMEGWQKYYTNQGILSSEEFYAEGLLLAYRVYDKDNNIVGEAEFKNGTGLYTHTFSNGQVAVELPFVKGQKQGIEKAYYPSGQLKYKGEKRWSKSQGEWFWYYPNGNVQTRGNYKDGDRSGTWYWYYQDGTLSSTSNYENGELHGVSKSFDFDGDVDQVEYYNHGQRHGARYSLGKDSAIALVRFYEYGIITGYTYLDQSGNLKPTIPIKDGTIELESFYQNGKTGIKATYKNGLFNGAYKRYGVNGKLVYQSQSINGRNYDTTKEYYANGQVATETDYKLDKRHGTRKVYFKNGKLHREEYYVYGEQEGETKVYNEQGKLVQTEFWFNDKMWAIENH